MRCMLDNFNSHTTPVKNVGVGDSDCCGDGTQCDASTTCSQCKVVAKIVCVAAYVVCYHSAAVARVYL